VVRYTFIIFVLFTKPNLCPIDTKFWRRHWTDSSGSARRSKFRVSLSPIHGFDRPNDSLYAAQTWNSENPNDCTAHKTRLFLVAERRRRISGCVYIAPCLCPCAIRSSLWVRDVDAASLGHQETWGVSLTVPEIFDFVSAQYCVIVSSLCQQHH